MSKTFKQLIKVRDQTDRKLKVMKSDDDQRLV